MPAAFVACTAASLLLAVANESFRYEERLGDTVDLATLSSELLAVVNQTVQPTSAALWLRPPAGGPGRPRPTATLRP